MQTANQWGIHDFVVGNEVNTRLYWSPQKDDSGKDVAAPAYFQLLARCYDLIHATDSAANVIGMGLSPRASTQDSNEPLVFLRDVGKAYRASGRTTPIMDQLSVHPYPNPSNPTEGPDAGYDNLDRFGIANLDRVKQAVYDAFNGTGQPTTLNGLTFVVDEVGWQTDTTPYKGYVNAENVNVVSEQTQASYIKMMVTKYFALRPDGRRRPALPARRRDVPERPRRDGQVHGRRLAERARHRRRRRRLRAEARLRRIGAPLRRRPLGLLRPDGQLVAVEVRHDRHRRRQGGSSKPRAKPPVSKKHKKLKKKTTKH